ncbi:chymotrypsin inhibitor-like [Anastrepha ludens]|uniref:chymotrypsin inhibitor-like n=1 Tax=Anastrepha ludens TaxID=28586 RepID=UPI0023AE8251|nr:chymotrypsin inhibitor-like [Anastrepha ludens]XP_053963840.1 chymotrypsin inhibitor-like [Anastrepha ludens]XP_053963841.1 chymotrypsin inhibitor-like [Anastrepha ludens]
MGNKIYLMFLLVIFSFATKATARPQAPGSACGPNSQYTSCGIACPAKCSDNPLLGQVCTAQCVVGCQCNPGYVLNNAGNCVLRSEC